MGYSEIKKEKFTRLPIIFFTVITPLFFIFSFGTVFASSPTANDDSYSTAEDTALIVASIGVLANDHDASGGIALLETAPLTGTLDLAASGAFTYTPLLNFSGIITFGYYISITGEISDVGNVTITVTAVNDPPLATNDHATTLEDTAVIIPVLANDSDVDGSLVPGTVTIITGPVNGMTGVNLTSGAVTYTPTLNFNGNDSFTYRVFDNGIPTPALSVTATVYLTITAVNDTPTALNDSGSTNEDTPLNVSQPGVLGNDNDVDIGDTLSVTAFQATSSKGGGQITVNANGDYSYNPTNAGALNALAVAETTIDTFTYTISDSGTLTDTATVSITVTGVNDPPTAVNDTASTNEDNILNVSAPGVLAGDSDLDTSDTIHATSTTTTSSLGAAVTINSDGSYSYNPQNAPALQALAGGGSIQDTFNYTITDGHGGNDGAIVTVTVSGSNDAPVLDNSGSMVLANINEDETNSSGTAVGAIIASAGGNRITDADTGAVEGIAVMGATNINGSWQYSLDGSNWNLFGAVSNFNAVLLDTSEFIRFVPNANYNGSAGTISFRAWDQTTGASGDIHINVNTNGTTTPYSTGTETATLTVLAVNDAPVLDDSGDLFLTSIGEDNITNPGDSVAAIVASAGGDRITDVDANSEEGIAVIGVDNLHGVWQYSINGGLNWSGFSVSSTSATLLGSQSRIRFVPQLNYSGTAGNITFRAWDLTTGGIGNINVNISQTGGTTAYSTDTETAALYVYSINDPPILDLNGPGGGSSYGFSSAFTEDGGAVRIVDTDLLITDVDNLVLASARAVLTNPLDGMAESLSVNTGVTGITAVYSTTTSILSITGPAPLTDFQTVLRTLSYNNTSQNPNTAGRVIEVRVNDGTDNSNLTESFVSITPVNDAPILVNNITLPVNEGGDATISVARLFVDDVDNTSSQIIYTVITPPAHGDLLLSNVPLITNNTFTQADINNSLVDYSHDASELPSDSFTFTVSDSSGGTIGVTTFNISVNPDNDSPVLAVNTGLTLDEQATSTITSLRLSVTDVDNTAVQLTYRLEVLPLHGNLLFNGTPLALNATFTQADINNNKLAYAHDGSETISDSFTFAVEDGSGGTIDSTLFAITINPVNDAPSIDLNGATTGTNFAADFTEDGGAVAIVDSASLVFDADNNNLLTATAVLSTHPDGTAESLSVNTSGTSISASYNPATGVLTLVGIDTVSHYQTVLRSLKYNNTSQDPTASYRTVTATVNDGALSSNVATSTITIHPVNDLPVLLINAGLTVDYGQTGVINNTLLRITDLDNSTSELVYTIKILPVNGQLKRNGVPLTVNSTLTQADINNGLLSYAHDKTNTESDSFQFTAVDGDGGSISQKTFAIVINPQPIVYLPAIFNNYVYGEPNNSACEAFAISINTSYRFLPDDKEDWYKFTLAAQSSISVQISNYLPVDGQMLVYSDSNCADPPLLAQVADITPSGIANIGVLEAGTYYVRIYTAVIPANSPPYTLRVSKP
ncbi:MAG: tandem-95 repeat protein [Ardenticatenaceae bacterium]|nr:tandem-95 repeat protein [Ardenticatenaceae bacterium]